MGVITLAIAMCERSMWTCSARVWNSNATSETTTVTRPATPTNGHDQASPSDPSTTATATPNYVPAATHARRPINASRPQPAHGSFTRQRAHP